VKIQISKLKDKKVLITRPISQADDLIKVLQGAGAKVIHIPLIEIADPSDHYRALDSAISQLEIYDWLIFTSQNAVLKFFERLRVHNKIPPLPPLKKGGGEDLISPLPLWERPALSEVEGVRVRGHIAAIGATTKKILQAEGISNVILPQKDSYSAQGLIKALKHYDFREKRVLFPSAREILETLPAWLKKRGAKVDVVETYETILPANIDKTELVRLISTNKVDAVFFHSPSAVKNFIEVVGKKTAGDFKGAFYCIGPTTSATLKAQGLTT
jgi:uroporphyrinogen III methyltransferase/synthase